MPIIDFKEIPEAHISTGKQDTFELFCQEFLKFLGLEIVSSPDRGADGGLDLLCIEYRKGGFGTSEIKWLVSCKHKAHSGKSVSPEDETNISDRLEQHKANGFLGFYSTLPSSGLNSRLNSYKDKYEIKVFNNEAIEEKLLDSPKGRELFKRFFKNSYDIWNRNTIKPAMLFDKYEPLLCEHCGKDLLDENEDNNGGLIGMIMDTGYSKGKDYHIDKYDGVYLACKGQCDRILESKYCGQNQISAWKDISDLKIPIEYMRWIMSFLNCYQEGTMIFNTEAFEKTKQIIMFLGQYVMRDLSDNENQRVSDLNMLPDWLR